MSFNLQNLGTVTAGGTVTPNFDAWQYEFPGFYNSITVIRPSDFRVVNTPVTLGATLLCDHAEGCPCPCLGATLLCAEGCQCP